MGKKETDKAKKLLGDTIVAMLLYGYWEMFTHGNTFQKIRMIAFWVFVFIGGTMGLDKNGETLFSIILLVWMCVTGYLRAKD